MAKFRTSHRRHNASSAILAKVGLFALFFLVIIIAFRELTKTQFATADITPDVNVVSSQHPDSIFFLPTAVHGRLVLHKHYALSYREDFEVAEWVAYELTGIRLRQPWVKRTDDFRPDPAVKTATAKPEDYRSPDYDRGHLVPAADMAFSEEAISETFLMSNITPQTPGFNRGVWRELEELTRSWAKKFHHLYVVSGPVFYHADPVRIGASGVAVPDAFFKVLLDLTEPEVKAIAFLIPNTTASETLEFFSTSIDEVESLTGIDFFYNLLSEELEAELESQCDPKRWPTSQNKYRKRVEKWNRH